MKTVKTVVKTTTKEPKPEKVQEPPKPMKIRQDKDWTEKQIEARRVELTVEEVPPGFVKVAEVGTWCKEMNFPVARLVRAFGGDRGMGEPVTPLFQIVYVGRTRYISDKVMTDPGIAILDDKNLGKEPPERKRKKKAEEPKPLDPHAAFAE